MIETSPIPSPLPSSARCWRLRHLHGVRPVRALLLLAGLGLGGCTTLTTVESVCGQGESATVCTGALRVPAEQAGQFTTAARQAIVALHDQALVARLTEFSHHCAGAGPWAPAWQGVDATDVGARLKAAAQGMRVDTYGGPIALFKYGVFGNLAYDGDESGPIRLNRWGLPRTPASLANTFTHELAHRIGLRHPSSSKDLGIAGYEPPYVIGTLVEQQIAGGSATVFARCNRQQAGLR